MIDFKKKLNEIEQFDDIAEKYINKNKVIFIQGSFQKLRDLLFRYTLTNNSKYDEMYYFVLKEGEYINSSNEERGDIFNQYYYDTYKIISNKSELKRESDRQKISSKSLFVIYSTNNEELQQVLNIVEHTNCRVIIFSTENCNAKVNINTQINMKDNGGV